MEFDNQVFSDSWLREKDIQMDLRSKFNKDNLNPISLLRILNSVKKIVNIVHGNNRYKVIFDGQESSGYINYSTKRIVLSCKLLKHPVPEYSTYDIVDILTGTGLHEAGHAEYSEKDPKKRSKLQKNLQKQLNNIFEDAVIEQIMANDFPGYLGYFIKLRKHYFRKDKLEELSGDKRIDRLNEFLIGLRYVGETTITDPKVQAALDKAKEILSLPNNELKKVDRIEFTLELFNIMYDPEDFKTPQVLNPISLGDLVGKVIYTENDEDDEIEEDSGEVIVEEGELETDETKETKQSKELTASDTVTVTEGENPENKEMGEVLDDVGQADVVYEKEEEEEILKEDNNDTDIITDPEKTNPIEDEKEDDVVPPLDEQDDTDNSINPNHNGQSGSGESDTPIKAPEEEEDIIGDIEDEDLTGDIKEFLDEQNEEKESVLTDDEQAALNQLEIEEYTELEEVNEGGRKFHIATCKPATTDYNKEKYKRHLENVKKLITTFRNKFSWANTKYNVNIYGLQSGNLDDDSLYSAKFNRNLFTANIASSSARTQNIDIAFVMDFSGSMYGELGRKCSRDRYIIAQELAILFSEALEPIKSINSWVLAFQDAEAYTGKKGNMAIRNLSMEEIERQYHTTQLVNLYSPTNKNKYAITSMYPGGSTPEYEALHGTLDMLTKFGKKDSKKIIVMMTDGGPYSNTFGSWEQEKLLKDILKKCEKKDVDVIHLALTDEAESTPYPHKIRWNNKLGYEGLVDGFLKTLKKVIK